VVILEAAAVLVTLHVGAPAHAVVWDGKKPFDSRFPTRWVEIGLSKVVTLMGADFARSCVLGL
jgi:hypothetical protein